MRTHPRRGLQLAAIRVSRACEASARPGANLGADRRSRGHREYRGDRRHSAAWGRSDRGGSRATFRSRSACPGRSITPLVIEATERVIVQVTDRSQGQCGLSVMVHGPHEIAPWFERGCRMFTYAADAVMLMNVARDAVEQFKNLLRRSRLDLVFDSGHVRRQPVTRLARRAKRLSVIAQAQGREGRGRRAAACARRRRPRPRPSRRRFRGSSQCRQGRSSSSPSGRAPAAIPWARCRRGS